MYTPYLVLLHAVLVCHWSALASNASFPLNRVVVMLRGVLIVIDGFLCLRLLLPLDSSSCLQCGAWRRGYVPCLHSTLDCG
ncbi:hypothetical protein BDQ17DRAFT_1367615 [Cyathus striatus]|nr:hypothetical protein BDQ17DRAFT_1367615 [Cyathus striatus]